MVEVTPEVLAGVAGSLISILLFLVPLLSEKFYNLADEWKQAINGGSVVVVSVVILALGCNEVIVIDYECNAIGLIDYVKVVGVAIMANSGTFTTLSKIGKRTQVAVHES